MNDNNNHQYIKNGGSFGVTVIIKENGTSDQRSDLRQSCSYFT